MFDELGWTTSSSTNSIPLQEPRNRHQDGTSRRYSDRRHERAFDLYVKCRYLDEQHPGRGIDFATGTPISNTMVEMYTEQRYLDPKG